MVDESRSLLEALRKRQRSWIGHVLRHDSLLKKVSGKENPWKTKSKVIGCNDARR